MSAATSWVWNEAKPCQRGALVVGVIGLGACVIGAIWNVEQFYHSWLLGWFSWLAIGVGSLAL